MIRFRAAGICTTLDKFTLKSSFCAVLWSENLVRLLKATRKNTDILNRTCILFSVKTSFKLDSKHYTLLAIFTDINLNLREYIDSKSTRSLPRRA